MLFHIGDRVGLKSSQKLGTVIQVFTDHFYTDIAVDLIIDWDNDTTEKLSAGLVSKI